MKLFIAAHSSGDLKLGSFDKAKFCPLASRYSSFSLISRLMTRSGSFSSFATSTCGASISYYQSYMGWNLNGWKFATYIMRGGGGVCEKDESPLSYIVVATRRGRVNNFIHQVVAIVHFYDGRCHMLCARSCCHKACQTVPVDRFLSLSYGSRMLPTVYVTE